jgi:uncharacterized protein Yka (UPF0111/DUF47 family)
MDDVADLIQDSAETMALYDVHHMTEEITRLTDLSSSAASACATRSSCWTRLPTRHCRGGAQDLRGDRPPGSDADRVMRSAMSKLFREEPDVREVIKLKAIYELLETITDKCEDVANVIEGIILENS